MSHSVSVAKSVKDFISLHSGGTLSTVSHSLPGYPFGSIVPYDLDREGRPIIFISLIAEHYKNVRANPKASICIADTYGTGDIQASARVTIVGDFAPVPAQEVEAAYWARFPNASERSIAHNFEFWRMTPVRLRWIGGFGDIRWIAAADYAEAPFDPIAYQGSGIIDHMNNDHRDALAEMLQHYAGVTTTAQACSMVAVQQHGFTVAYQGEKGTKRIDLQFPAPALEVRDVRTAIIAMLTNCRNSN